MAASAGGIPIQAYAFLGAVGAFLIVLVVFFLYLNKKLCFAECGGFPCIDHPVKKEPKTARLGSAYAYEDHDSSSESDDEILRRYHQSMRRQAPPNFDQDYRSQTGSAAPSSVSKRSSQRSNVSGHSSSSRKSK